MEAWSRFSFRTGLILLAASKDVRGFFKVDIAEALAVRCGVEIAVHYGFQQVEAESDCLLLVDAFRVPAI